MKQKTAFFLCFVCILCTTLPGFTEGFQLVDKKDMKLLLNLRFAFLGSVDIQENAVDVSISSAGMAIRGELYKWLDFKVSFDAVQSDTMVDYDYTFLLKDLYIRHDFHDYIGIRAGRFKTPFGEEVFYSLGERPYMQRTNTTREIPPGRDLGIMVSGRKMINLFGYDLGLFSGKVPGLPEDAISPYLLAGKLYVRYKGLNLLDIKAGYNAYYHYYNHGVSQHNLAQGFFGKTVLSFDRNNELSILAEYQERLKLRNVINQNMDWARGIFVVVSYRYTFIEPLVLLEWYDGSLLRTDADDLFSLKTGLAGYFLKNDLLRIKLLYDLEYPYDSGVLSHKVSAMLQMEF